ncbi:MAG TPA: SAF domain-containing protein [Acidimicrobiales bacterium]|nr:SAF domain-containing protein [Acidimicrobiales bacterium]
MPATAVPRPRARAPRPSLGRRPSLFWLAALVLAGITGLTMARLLAGAQAGAARWGELRATLVATTDLAPGTVLGPGGAEVRRLPASLVPETALTQPAAGEVVAEAILAGEPVVADRLAPAGLSPVAATLAPGSRGIAVPGGAAGLPLEVGDRVDVLVTFDPDTVGDGEPTFAVARSAAVAAVGKEAVTLSVGEDEAARVAFALTAGVVTLTLDPRR